VDLLPDLRKGRNREHLWEKRGAGGVLEFLLMAPMRQRNIVDGCIFTLFGARYESNLILWETHVGRSNRWNVHLLTHTHEFGSRYSIGINSTFLACLQGDASAYFVHFLPWNRNLLNEIDVNNS
jgi:hypothetical protein